MNINLSKGHENYNFQIPVKVILDDYDFPILLEREKAFSTNSKLLLMKITRE